MTSALYEITTSKADDWLMIWAPPTEPGAVPITVMRHPATPATATGLPDPAQGAPAAWAP
ncbi:hypothetical protein [Streptomyces sp. YKOK-I1]